MVQQSVLGSGAHGHVVDLAGHQEAEGVHDVDEVVEDHPARLLGEPDPVLLHEDQLARVVGALRVAGGVTPVEADGEADTALLGELHQPLGAA